MFTVVMKILLKSMEEGNGRSAKTSINVLHNLTYLLDVKR